MVSNVYRITSYHCDENGNPVGEPYTHLVYTDTLMETYKNPKYVVKIEMFDRGDTWHVIWTPNYDANDYYRE